jgi:hypothetical protein
MSDVVNLFRMFLCSGVTVSPETHFFVSDTCLSPPLSQVGEDGTGPGGGASGEGAGETSVFGGSEAAFPGPRVLVVWLMAVTDGASIGKCFYGAYASEDAPPEKYWLPFADEEKGLG